MAMAAKSNMTREKAVFVAQQLHFANSLAGNDPTQRARAMKKLRKYFVARANGNCSFTHDDFMRIWKGLFYCMWMSDKPLIQEELAEEISQLIHCFQHVDVALTFVRAFFDTLLVEWFGIDYHRMDKFQMFVRRFLRQSLVYCKNKTWKNVPVSGLCDVFESTLLSPECAKECGDISLIMHFSDIFLEELAKVGSGKLSEEIVLLFLKPFITNLAGHNDIRLQHVIRERVFYSLINQSPEGLEYEEKFEAWKRAGFPGTSWKDMVFVGKEDNRSGVKINSLDPRAGKVNVYLPHLQFDARAVADALRESARKSSNKQSRQCIQHIAYKFQTLAKGIYPLETNITKHLLNSNKYRFSKENIDDAVEDLLNFEQNLKMKDKEIRENCKRKKNASKLTKSKRMKLENSCTVDEEGSTIEITSEVEGNDPSENEKEKLSDNENKVEGIYDYSIPLALDDQTEVAEPALLQNGSADIHENAISATNGKEQIICELEKEVTLGNEAVNSFSTKITKKGKKQNVSSWNVSEIPSLQEEIFEENCQDREKIYDLEEELKGEVHTKIDKTCFEGTSFQNELQASDEGGEKELIASCEVNKADKPKKVVTPLRRSARRKSNLVSTPNKINMEKDEMTSDSKLPYENEQTPVRERKSLTPGSIIRTKRRISTVPDREIPYVHESGGPLDSINYAMTNVLDSSASSSINDTCNGVLRNEVPSPVQKVFQTPGKKRVSLNSTPASTKKVNIVLQMNKSQAVSDYDAALKQSPSIPYDANKMPCKGVLKRTSMRSPMNPFYVPSKRLK